MRKEAFAFFGKRLHQEFLAKVGQYRIETGAVKGTGADRGTKTSLAGFVAAQADQNSGIPAGLPVGVGVAFLLKDRVEQGQSPRVAGTDAEDEAGSLL